MPFSPWPPQLQASGSQAGVYSPPALSNLPATHREVPPSCLTDAEVSAPTLRGAVGEQVSWGEGWRAVTTGIQLAMTETGASHAGVLWRGSSSSGPSCTCHSGWNGPLLSSQSAMPGTRLTPGLGDSLISPYGLTPCSLEVAVAPPLCF